MFGIIKQMFMGLLISIFNASNHIKSVSLNNQICMIQPTLISSHPKEYIQDYHNYLFAVELDRCARSCRFKSKRAQLVYRNKWIEHFNKAYIMRM